MQTVIVALVIVLALAYLGRKVWDAVAGGRRARAGACGSGCGCESAAHPPARQRG